MSRSERFRRWLGTRWGRADDAWNIFHGSAEPFAGADALMDRWQSAFDMCHSMSTSIASLPGNHVPRSEGSMQPQHDEASSSGVAAEEPHKDVINQLKKYSLVPPCQVPSCLLRERLGETVRMLQDMLRRTQDPERQEVKGCLKKVLTFIARHPSSSHRCDEREIAIRRLLDIPLLENKIRTLGDGDCLLAAWFGEVSTEGYCCTNAEVQHLRQKLKDALNKENPLALPDPVKVSVNVFLHDTSSKRWKEVEKLFGGHPPGDPYDALDDSSKAIALRLFAEECGEAGQYLFTTLVPFIAKVEGQPVSLYQDPETGNGGWSHYDANGEECERPVEGARAIRYDLIRQHFERVEPPERKGSAQSHLQPSHKATTNRNSSLDARTPRLSPIGNSRQMSGFLAAQTERQRAEVFRQLEKWSKTPSLIPTDLSRIEQDKIVDLLAGTLHSGSPPEQQKARGWLEKILDWAEKRRPDPFRCHPLENTIRFVLGIPWLESTVPTVNDGDSLLSAWFGEVTAEGYRCPERDVQPLRQTLKAELIKLDSSDLPSEVKESVMEFLRHPPPQHSELVSVLLRGKPPADTYDAWNEDELTKGAALGAFARECVEARQNLSPALVPFIAKVMKSPVSLYQDPETGNGGWSHYDANGKGCDRPVEGARAIRYDLTRQHFERVEPPERQRTAPGDSLFRVQPARPLQRLNGDMHIPDFFEEDEKPGHIQLRQTATVDPETLEVFRQFESWSLNESDVPACLSEARRGQTVALLEELVARVRPESEQAQRYLRKIRDWDTERRRIPSKRRPLGNPIQPGQSESRNAVQGGPFPKGILNAGAGMGSVQGNSNPQQQQGAVDDDSVNKFVQLVLSDSGSVSAKREQLIVGKTIELGPYYSGYGLSGAVAGAAAAVKGDSDDPLKNLPLGLEPGPFLKTFTSILPLVIGQARVIDSLFTADGLRAVRNQRREHVTACRNHLKALMGLRALDRLEETRKNELTGQDKKCIEQARAQLIRARDNSENSFHAIIPAVHDVIRNQVAAARDVGGNTVNSLLAVVNFAGKLLNDLFKGAPTDAAAGLIDSLPYLNSGLGITTGSLSATQGAMEIHDALRSEEALAAADIADKEVVAKYGKQFPELKALLKLRQLDRELEGAFARWLKAHGSVRAVYGAAALTQAALGIAMGVTAGALGGATLGASLILGILAGALYMLWINARAAGLRAEQKNYYKALQTIYTLAGLAPSDLPGLTVGTLSLKNITAELVQYLRDPGTATDMTQALKDLGVPPRAIKEAITQGPAALGNSLLPARGIPVTMEDALRNIYAASKATAADKLRVVELWQADQELAAKDLKAAKVAPKTESWGKYLASGDDVDDLRKSSLTRALVVKFWEDKKFRDLMDTFKVFPTEELTPEVAWRRLDRVRKKQAIEEKAAATVMGWIEGRKFRTIMNCLEAGKKNAEIPEFVALKKFKIKTVVGPDHKDIVDIGSLRNYYAKRALHINNIAQIRAVCKASGTSEKSEFFERIDRFVVKTEASLGLAEKGAFIKALGGPCPLRLNKEGKPYSFSTSDPDAVLKKIQQFLLVSEKLQRQPVNKVIAALHAYPTDADIPRDLLHIAAVRTLRLAYRDRDENDVNDAVRVAKQLAVKPLHRRTLGAGEGGGFMGFGGYELNKRGLAVLDLFQQCRAPQPTPQRSQSHRPGDPKPGGLSIARVDPTVNQAIEGSAVVQRSQSHTPANPKPGGLSITQADPTTDREHLVDVLQRLSKRMLPEPVTSLDDLVDELALLRDQKALKDALALGEGSEYAMAKRSLSKLLERAVNAIKKAADSYDGAGFVENVLKLIELEKLLETYELNLKLPALKLDREVFGRWRFYKDALRWPNTTARNKNAAAIAEEIALLPVSGAAGPERSHLWSAKFLKAQSAEEMKRVMNDLKRRYPWTEGMSYKEAAQAINDLDRMSSTDVFKAVKAFDSRYDGMNKIKTFNSRLGDMKKNQGYHWVAKQFMVRGLEIQTEEQGLMLMEQLAEAKDKHEFLLMMRKCLHSTVVRKPDDMFIPFRENQPPPGKSTSPEEPRSARP